MSKIAIVTDTTSTIPQTLLEKMNIQWVPYYIHRGSEVLRDFVNVRTEEFYDWLPTAEELPTTANPGPQDYIEKYELAVAQGAKEIISMHMSSLTSGAYKAALVAKDMFAEKFPEIRVEVVDTLTASMTFGYMVLEAARAAVKDVSVDDILAKVKDMIPKSGFMQTADTLDYLYKGGRIGKAKHLMGSVLNIKPIIAIEEGLLVPFGQARTRKKVYAQMVEKLDRLVGDAAVQIAYVHAAAREEAEKLKYMVEQRVEVVESMIAELPPSLGVHTGPGTVGFSYVIVEDTI